MPKAKQKGETKKGKGAGIRDRTVSLELSSSRLVTLRIVIVVLLAINSILLIALWLDSVAVPAVLTVETEDQIYLDIEGVQNDSVTYSVWVNLKNTGGKMAHVSASGEVWVSLYGSAYGEEVQGVLDYVSVTISPGDSRWLSFGTFTTSPGWHYVVHIHISWNGGSLELIRTVT